MNFSDLLKEISYLINSREKVFGAYLITRGNYRHELIKNLKELSDYPGIHIRIQSLDIHTELRNFRSVLNTPLISSRIPKIILERARNVERLVAEGYGPEIHAFYIAVSFDRKGLDHGFIDNDTVDRAIEDAKRLLEDSDYLYLSFD